VPDREPMPTFLEFRADLSSAWRPEDAVLFAASIGAEPGTDLDYLDLSRGPRVMPTFAAVRMSRMWNDTDWAAPWAFDPHDTFLLGCDISILRHVPATAATESVNEVIELWDKGSSAVFHAETRVSVDGEHVSSLRTTVMVRGRGGFGGDRGPPRASPPSLDAATELPVHLPANSAVLYQLVGEHNPHSLDPEFAAQAGLPGPISAGQVLIGAASRTLTTAFANGDHRALTRIAVDYAGSHVAGRPLTLRVQQDGTNAFAFNLTSGDQPVLLGGRAELT
jgi:hypothetical protein